MKRCVSCLRPNTLPGATFNDEGVCPACERFEARKTIDYNTRRDFLKKLCDEHRSKDGSYDCIIPVSGGKDSFFQVDIMVQEYGMHPLLVCVTDPFTHTPEGVNNYDRIARAFRCDTITARLDPARVAASSLVTLENMGSTNWEVDKAIYAWPLQIAKQMEIPLVIYGENVSWEYGGPNAEDTYDANAQIKNNVVSKLPGDILMGHDKNMLRYLSENEMDAFHLQAIYLSWFYPWNDFVNVAHAEKHGFRRLRSYQRAGYIDDYAQIDSLGYLFNYYLKFMKYGIGRIVDIGSRWVRYGGLSRDALKEEIQCREGEFDYGIATDFCRTAGTDLDALRPILSKWWNRDIFDVAEGSMEWKWKDDGFDR